MKKHILGLLLFSAFTVNLLSKDVLIIYDGEKEKSEAFISACYIRNLLDHFSVESQVILHVSEYKKGMAEEKDYLFVIFEESKPSFPDIFMKDLVETGGIIIWIHSHIDRLLEQSPKKWGISFLGDERRNDWKITYKGQDFAKEDPWLNIVKIEDKATVKVYAWVMDSRGRKLPYILKSKNLWCIADSPFSYAVEGGRFLILADLLHNILEEYHSLKHKALVRIEDVNPEDDPSAIRKIAGYLNKERIPFQISLIPLYKIPDAQYEVSLSDRPAMVEALKYAVSKGGTIVLHGITHQHRGTTAEDFEFWDDIEGKPITHGSSDWIDQRLKNGISECVKNGIYPLSWETPHYSASKDNYRTFAQYFDTFYERVMAAEISGTQQIFPYQVRLREFEISVIPENLGYVDFEKPDPQVILENARNMLVVRDGIASFFFHPFVPMKHLKNIIKKMKKMGWEFVSIKDFGCNLRTDSLWVTSSGGEGIFRLEDRYLHEILFNKRGKIAKEEFSIAKHTGLVKKKLNLPDGSFYVMEALDDLPEEKKESFLDTVKARIKNIFKAKEEKILHISKALIIVNKAASREEDFDQRSFQSVLNVFGFNPEIRDMEELSALRLKNFDLLVAPYSAAKNLKDAEINVIVDFIKRGGILITDGRTPLAERLGIWFEDRRIKVAEVQELSIPAHILRWSPPTAISPFSTEDALILAKDAWRDMPIALIKPFKKGKVLFLGALFDPFTPYGISRFPYFPHYLKNSLGLSFNIRRNNLEFYFDPGLRQNTSWEKLVKRWRESGVKIVYLATWHFYRKYEFDYAYFIDLCHDHGIAVYAWFELPQVSPRFWDDFPQWREKTATGEDAQCHWRFLMNLYNHQARNEAKSFLWKIMMNYDWDGVNLAELNFDTNKGALDPAKFTPMNKEVRDAFKKRESFDPIELFNPRSSFYWKKNQTSFDKFLKFRTEIIKELHIFFLEELEKIKRRKNKDMEVIVTAMDSLLHPETIEESGIDTRDIISLMDRFPFTLQVEDPSRSWVNAPSRYLTYYMAYKEYIEDNNRLMFDINVISRRDISSTRLPSLRATGTELATTLFYATLPSGRAGIYSEYTIHPFDMDILPYVTGSDVEISEGKNGYYIFARKPFTLSIGDLDFIPFMNEKIWPFYGNMGLCVASGKNFLSFKKARMLDFQMLSPRILLDADIIDLKTSKNTYSLRYRSTLPVSLTFSRPLERVRLDSEPLALLPEKLGVILPKGDHELEISMGSQSFQVIDEVGYVSSSIFYLLGLISMSSLLAIYVYSRIRR